MSRIFAPAMHIPPAGLTVRTVIDGKEQGSAATTTTTTPTKEEPMPRGVYERKKKAGPDAPAKPGRKPRRQLAAPEGLGDVLALLYKKRDSINAAIAAIEGLRR